MQAVAPARSQPVTGGVAGTPASTATVTNRTVTQARRRHHRAHHAAPTRAARHAATTAAAQQPSVAPMTFRASRLPAVAGTTPDTGALARGGLALLVLALASAALLDRVARARRGARGPRERW